MIADPDNEWGQDYSWDAIIFRKNLDPFEAEQPITTVVETASGLRIAEEELAAA